jgi:hypothetical protein
MSLKAASEKGSDQTLDDFNTPEDKALVRKIDLRSVCLFSSFDLGVDSLFSRLLPILTLLYLLSFLDRYVP